MRIFLSEFLTGGGLPERERSPGLLAEGRAMLAAAARDLGRLPGISLLTTLGAEIEWRSSAPVMVERVDRPDAWPDVFDRCCRASDATLVIAPETGGVLTALVRRVEELGRAAWNCRPDAIETCTDKLALAERLERAGVRTIPTTRVAWHSVPPAFPVVVKPRDGAGSLLTRRVDSPQDWQRLREEYVLAPELEPILQPCSPGRTLSQGVVFSLAGDDSPIFLPIAEQRLTNDGKFTYQGGRLPAQVADGSVRSCRELILRTVANVPGLRGYVGFDLLLPEDGQEEPVLVEINPRLTTSFVGYAQLCPVPIASLWNGPVARQWTWPDETAWFSAAGEVIAERVR